MILSLGGFKFEANINPGVLKRSVSYGLSTHERINNYPLFFSNKKMAEKISIVGTTLPLQGAKNNAIKKLYDLANKQISYALTNGSGKFFGYFFILNIEEEQKVFLNNGIFLEQTFNIELSRDYK